MVLGVPILKHFRVYTAVDNSDIFPALVIVLRHKVF